MAEKLLFEKVVDKSALSDGITIPEAYHSFLYEHIGHRLQHGESMQLQVEMQGSIYTVSLRNLDFDTEKYKRHDILQIRYSKNSPIATALRSVFIKTTQRVGEQKVRGKENVLQPVAKDNEYIMLYTGGSDSRLLLDPITTGDISVEMEQIASLPEIVAEQILSTDDTARIDEKLQVSKIRKMNLAIGNSLKLLYGYRCQICGQYIGEPYGSTLIHAHHIDYFSRSMNNDASNIMIVCPNHHGIIHDRNPVFNVRDKTYKYPNGYVEGLALNKHL